LLILGSQVFVEGVFRDEKELERVVVENYEYLFGPLSLYFETKKLIKTGDGYGTLPDGFAIDLASRKWYIVEAELGKHSVHSHINPQVTRQLIASRNPRTKRLVVDAMVEKIFNDTSDMGKFANVDVPERDVFRVVSDIVNADPVVGIPIDFIQDDLREWSKMQPVRVVLWTVEKFVEYGKTPEVVVYKFPAEIEPALDTRENEADGADESSGKRKRKRIDVGIPDLIEKGLLSVGDKLTMTWKPRGGDDQKKFEAKVLATGELEVDGRPYSVSESANIAKKTAGAEKPSCNGWVLWKTASGVLLSDLRDRYTA
jgi:hypothetical protein